MNLYQTQAISRRRFVKGTGAGAIALSAGSLATASRQEALKNRLGPSTIHSNHVTLNCAPLPVNFTGKNRLATAINGSVPAPTLRFKEGQMITIDVNNQLSTDTSIHWHGLILPSSQDGVPHISTGFKGIAPGASFRYQFPAIQSGTYWYHSHSGFQEQTGAYGAIIIDPKEPDPVTYDRDYTVLLSDWSDEQPEKIYAKLKKMSHYYNKNERTLVDLWRDIKNKGVKATAQDRAMWNQMRMSSSDISDVTGMTYTFLMNGVTPENGWLGLFKKGERLRLRFINGSAMTFFDIQIPGLKMTVVAADGQNIQPVSVDEFRIGVAETYDVIVEPSVDEAYTIFAQAIDRSGYASGTLAAHPSMQAAVPAMDAPPRLSHRDMGMSMNHAMHDQKASQQMNHAKPIPMAHSTMDHSMYKEMKHRAMDHSAHRKMQHQPMPDKSMHHSGTNNIDSAARIGSGLAGYGSAKPVSHGPSEFGPHIDARPDNIQYRLDDPGVGLRERKHKVLTYADIRNLYPTQDKREPEREIDLHLTGNMSRYMWSFNGIAYKDAEPMRFKYGERLRVNLINDTMMNHPIHLHGMWSELETGDPNFIPKKHTIVSQPSSRISYLVTADALGPWPLHCHLIYHMAGMFRKVVVEE